VTRLAGPATQVLAGVVGGMLQSLLGVDAGAAAVLATL
jgi:hypothetical protein